MATAETPRWEDAIGPLLKMHCVKCHGPAKRQAKLDLSSAAAVRRGGENGPVVAPHDLAASRLWERLEAGEMPPDNPLSEKDKTQFKQWILGGAPGLPTAENSSRDAATEHWAFQPLKPSIGPMGVDFFLSKRQEQLSLTAAPPAKREKWIRRVSFALTGLPPTPEAVDRFVRDEAVDAYERMIERYLASPHYGERWGKYWLDVAGYADSNGYFNADTDRPTAYRYRDYVVRAFNEDRPFDQFIREQLAGDELARFDPSQPVTDEMIQRLEATHFLRNGQDGTGESDGNPDELRVDRYAALESAQQIAVSALLGLTIQCAKCHDHKFEPITQADYYRLQAIFYPVFPAAHADLWRKPQERFVHAATAEAEAAWQQAVAAAKGTDQEKAVSESRPGKIAWATNLIDPPPAVRLLIRGNYAQPGDEMRPANLAVLREELDCETDTTTAPDENRDARRLAWANELTRPNSRSAALMARVQVNRIWQQHFGVGIVATSDNLGLSGDPPAHPDLLDWLATEFVQNGWSVKHIQRLILNSETYRRDSAEPTNSAAVGNDPENRCLSRFPILRLDAEAIRDAQLFVSGELDSRIGGPYVPTTRHHSGEVAVGEDSPGARRRSIYLQQRRTQGVSLLQLFDAPTIVFNVTRRPRSTMPLQSLSLLNAPFVRRRAAAWSENLHREPRDDVARLSCVFQAAYSRPPNDVEIASAASFLAEQTRLYGNAADAARRAWIDLCQMLLASNEFLYVD